MLASGGSDCMAGWRRGRLPVPAACPQQSEGSHAASGRSDGKCRAVQSRADVGPAAGVVRSGQLAASGRRRGLHHGRSCIAWEVAGIVDALPAESARARPSCRQANRGELAQHLPCQFLETRQLLRRGGPDRRRVDGIQRGKLAAVARLARANRPPSPRSFRCGIAVRKRNRRPGTPDACTRGFGPGGRRRRGDRTCRRAIGKPRSTGGRRQTAGRPRPPASPRLMYQPISFTRLEKTLAPHALASNCEPRQMPSVGSRAAKAWRIHSISAVRKGYLSVSSTFIGPPMTTNPGAAVKSSSASEGIFWNRST